eukprot:TRINITY_DN6259_c0_g1_i1.p1 TRINITY_DN6259_c0_g1~~TRINITY_DN6259_c0_g1_i1.p1  ORF type:complete len:161 (-),score=16.24 TRINITY_DN6259_c0_g1_i1:39-521(-)
MVCIVCLLPLFLLPVAKYMPDVYDQIMVFLYKIVRMEYKKPVREELVCPYKPGSKKDGKNKMKAPHKLPPSTVDAEEVKVPTGPLGHVRAWIDKKIFLYNVTFGLYMLDWWERYLFNTLGLLLLWFVCYNCYRFSWTLYDRGVWWTTTSTFERPPINGVH